MKYIDVVIRIAFYTTKYSISVFSMNSCITSLMVESYQLRHIVVYYCREARFMDDKPLNSDKKRSNIP